MPNPTHDLHPVRRGAPYTYGEVELIYRTPASARNAEELAAHFQRTPGAIHFAWRWMDADPERFPAKAFNRLFRLVEEVRAALGSSARGCGVSSSSSHVA